ncbi:DNA-processing protein DprA [Acinetobacter puyangensis]|uniref:DNA processing protein n=1 Tax=Acinetobacter puyangensis TaxID=1096779 RepID=A0A240E2P1_9GAMM|nr:DNA-processing protein DprA [Acinetobacter puyangensis]SNX43038.1 DNA processing protein [Acinetobacter puyangensis]
MQISQVEREQLTLWYLLHHSFTAYNRLIQYFGDAHTAIQPNAVDIWRQLKLHANHIERLQHFHTAPSDLDRILQQVEQYTDHILFKGQAHYPAQLAPHDDSPPILFVQGNADVLHQPQIAMVGSRSPSPHGAQIAYDFAHFFAEKNYVVSSGLALGIDAACHHGAIQKGQSIAVIGTGLDQCYPAAHQSLWQSIIAQGGAIISEFLPNTPPAKPNFPRRNRIISGLSLGTVVVEAGLESGSLITAKKAADQGKQVFAIPGHIYSQYHQGCHQLIRDGATLVDHPLQVIEDLNMFGHLPSIVPPSGAASSAKPVLKKSNDQSTAPQTENVEIPEHLNVLYQQLDWIGISIDELAIRLNQNIIDLNVALVELELLGLCKQHGGRYLRC